MAISQKSKAKRKAYAIGGRSAAIFLLFTSTLCQSVLSQGSKASDVQRFPYSFTNLAWWSDADLRTLLKSAIPGLPDEIPRDSSSEGKIRDALKALLLKKGIHAEVQSFEPPMSNLPRAEGAPPASIQFSVAEPPKILIGKVTVQNSADVNLSGSMPSMQGRPYNRDRFWSDESQMKNDLQNRGYLAASVHFRSESPLPDGSNYIVPLAVVIDSGALFHVSSISIDGGPLSPQKDLTPYVPLHVGDIANTAAFGRLAGGLRPVYWKQGYEDVDFESNPKLDSEHALVSYRFQVLPGPQYHLGTLTIKNLDVEQENEARSILGMKVGDVYDGYAVTTLNSKLSGSLKGYDLTFSPHEDKAAKVIDLMLEFYKR